MKTALKTWRSHANALWQQRSPRERLLLSVGAVVMALAWLWYVGLAPALHTWQEAPAKQALLDQQSQQMLQLQMQAQSLQKPQAISRSEAIQWLESHLGELGPNAQLNLQAEHMNLRLQAAPADQLANWIGQAREQAHIRPVQAQLQQAAAPSADNALVWSGSLLLRLP